MTRRFRSKIFADIAFTGASYEVKAIAAHRNIALAASTFDLAKNELISTLKLLKAFGSIVVINSTIVETI